MTINRPPVSGSRLERRSTAPGSKDRTAFVRRAAAGAVAALALVAASPAQGAPLEREHYSGADSYDFDDCGPLVHVEIEFGGVFLLKAPTQPGAPPRYFDNYEAHEVLTANGRTMTIDHDGLYKDLSATLVSGTTYRFVGQESGQPFVVRDGSGAVLVRDRGLLRTTFVVDTKGDTDLGNDEFVDGSLELLADHGSHPGFYLDYCQLIAGYFG